MIQVRLEINFISDFNKGYFKASVSSGREYKCIFQNKGEDWDKIYNYLTKPMTAEVKKIDDDTLLVLKIC